MTRPAILTVDDDEQVSAAIGRDLRRRYGRDYRIMRASSGDEALEVLAGWRCATGPWRSSRSTSGYLSMTGIETLAAAQERGLADGAKRLLLTAYADTGVAIQAINDIGLDHYLFKPWDPPEENLYPVIDDLLDDWHAEHPDQTSDVRVVDHRWSDRGYEVKTFLARNHVPYRWFDVELDDEGERLAGLAGATAGDLPLVLPPRASPCAPPPPSSSPARSASARRPSSRSTTCASSGAVRPAWPRPSTPRPRGSAPSWSSGRRRAARPAPARRSRTTSASPRDSAAPTSPTARWPRCSGSARRWCWPATWWRSSSAGLSAPSCSTATARRHRGPLGDRVHRASPAGGSRRKASTT